MLSHNLVQGSLAWHEYRRTHFNASDAPAMMGVSKYKTRQKLLHELHTGLTDDIDADTQKNFAEGHRSEALARPLAEKIIGEELSAVVGSKGKYSASFDGLTMLEDTAFEHKSLNDEIRACSTAQELHPMYRIQMEQQLMISGASRCLFMATKWNGIDLLEEKHFWYEPDMELRGQIIAGWEQFEKDLAAYIPPEVTEKPKTEAVEAFPVPSIQVKGELVTCNLDAITPYFDKFLADTPTILKTDADFAQAEVNAKASREAAKNCKLTAKAVVDQIMPVSDVVRTLEGYASKFDALGLQLEKAVKEQKEAIKTAAISNARSLFNDHVASLEDEIKTIRLNAQAPDFAGAIKGIRTIESLHERINQALVDGKLAVDAQAKDIRDKLTWCKVNAEGYGMLFPDLQQIIVKPMDDFQLLIKTRIEQHKQAEAEKEARIRAEAEAKAKADLEKAIETAKQIEKQPEPSAQIASASKPVITTVAPTDSVIESQDIIAAFLKERNFKKADENKYRAILVEFVKFQAEHNHG